MRYIEIDTQSRIPIYAQIMDRIHALVREGTLPPHCPLPSVRQLATDLEINPNTVAKAYGLLEREGLLVTARRRGTLVAGSAPDIAQKAVGERLSQAIDRVLEEAAGLGVGLGEIIKTLERRAREKPDQPSERRPT